MYVCGGIGVIKNFLLLFLFLLVAFFKIQLFAIKLSVICTKHWFQIGKYWCEQNKQIKSLFQTITRINLCFLLPFNQNVLTLHSDLFFALKNTIKVTSKALLIVQEVEVATYYLFRSENCRKCYRSVYIREF